MTDTVEQAITCGTYAAYQRHYKAGETIDEACRRAAADYTAGWRVRTGRTKNVVVPLGLLGELLTAATPDVVRRVSSHLGETVCAKAIEEAAT